MLFLLLLFMGIPPVFVNSASTSFCKIYEWSCDDDTCIDGKLKCNGVADCPDGSDETFLLCRNTDCNGFTCVYGGCVSNNATCNGVKDCIDNSDELLLECRNETTYTECISLIPDNATDYVERWKACEQKGKTCDNGQLLEDFVLCDGKVDCEDGSDETLKTCATDGPSCKGDSFRCQYGGCVGNAKVCNDIIDCADGSDELAGLCSKNDDDISEWKCDDGTRINVNAKCNGAVDCPDGSDETFILCRNNKCPFGFAKCVYGGCVKNSALCNGVKECADNSDELLRKCRNESSEGCLKQIGTFLAPNFKERLKACQLKDKTCNNGQVLEYHPKCDGRVDCSDGSDETLETCATDIRDCDSYYGGGWKFRCRYGGCIAQSRVCNGVIDCADGSDELKGLCYKNNDNKIWTCEDGTRIGAKMKCNGAVDCPDGSDETFLLCRNIDCSLGFRCVYGGCVNNSAACNGVKDCADNSDELLMKCRNAPTFMTCFNQLITQKIPADVEKRKEQLKICNNLDKMCKNGQILESSKDRCNGKVDCEDGSDETLETCATDINECEKNKNFRCENGGCIDPTKVCNKIKDCADGSDESDGLCYKGKCVLPEHPSNGNYTVLEKPNAYPGQVLDSVLLIFNCNSGYKLYGTSIYVNCLKGSWPYNPPRCLSQCNLKKDSSIVYWCLPRGTLALETEHECGELVPDGATVRPECSKSIFHYTGGVLDLMHCVDGKWDRQIHNCSLHCGLVTSEANKLIINGTSAKRGELPWHAGIYDKRSKPYEQICGGSLISKTVIISAAHCFWSDLEKLLPARYYAVALGKLYRPWNDTHEVGDQKSDVRDIKIPPRFKGSAASFQEDIALVILVTAVEFRSYVLPVCVDFGMDFETKQLSVGNIGKVSGWGLTAEDGKRSPVLKVADLPFIDIDQCYAESPPSFYKFITGDKFCAGSSHGPALCKGDSGGGLVFPSKEGSDREERYFLRGVVSTAPRNDHACNAFVHTTFTKITNHRAFILEHWN